MAKEYIVYTKWLALALRKQGFKLLGTGINERFPQYDTYIFEETEELHNAIFDLTAQCGGAGERM